MRNNINIILNNLSKSKFRSSFHLNKKMKQYVMDKEIDELLYKGYNKEEIFNIIMECKNVKKHLEGLEVGKIMVIKNKIVTIVAK